MRKGFTLVELLVVVVVIVTLMGIVIRLGAIGTDSSSRNTTISRMQRIENALSGYYAAFGTYPPVALQGSRNIYMPVDGAGLQKTDGSPNTDIFGWKDIGEKNEIEAWEQVEAACRAQPFAARFPFSDDKEWKTIIEGVSDMMKESVSGMSDISDARRQVLSQGFSGANEVLGILQGHNEKTDWREVEVFQYGVMSYLLPRYLIMCKGNQLFYEDFKQWKGYNNCPRNPFNGDKQDWDEIVRQARSTKAKDKAMLEAIPSQAVCARWMPNFKEIVDSNQDDIVLFGVKISNVSKDSPNRLDPENANIQIYRPGGANGGSGDQYILDSMTVLDGWGHEFYYYSEAPYQSYKIWSAGANGRTFPPWVPKDSFKGSELECIALWIKDDIMSLSK